MTDTDRSASSSSNSSGESGGQGFTDEVRQRAIGAYDSALDSASNAGRKTNEAIEASPLVALGAGIAAGALIAALLPTSRRERDLLKPYGDKVTRAARDAADAARETGSEKLRELGLTPDTLADKAGKAAKASAEAAVGRFKDEAGSR